VFVSEYTLGLVVQFYLMRSGRNILKRNNYTNVYILFVRVFVSCVVPRKWRPQVTRLPMPKEFTVLEQILNQNRPKHVIRDN
jgi:hypothetical protein